eukprot:10146163-Prorocentrum_lima.AAC.1
MCIRDRACQEAVVPEVVVVPIPVLLLPIFRGGCGVIVVAGGGAFGGAWGGNGNTLQRFWSRA